MSSAPGSTLLRPGERELFIEEFEKDLKFLQVFMLLMNRSCPIKNVDLVWVENGPSGRSGWRHVGIIEALEGPCSRLLRCTPGNPHPVFCNIVNDYGLREAESCGISDKSAEDRVSRTGKAEVYRCHFGLTDIAVPVIANGRHVATLFSGQVLREAPSESGFEQIGKDVAHLKHVSPRELREAYWNCAVVSEEDIRNTVVLLEVFAEYLASSWERLLKAVQQERQHNRELAVLRKEFAYLVLDRDADLVDARAAMTRLGIRNSPNRVLMVKLETEDEKATRAGTDRAITTALYAIDELCDKLDDVVHTNLRGRGVCIFLHDRGGSRRPGRMSAQQLAQTILHTVANRCPMRVRIGVGEVKPELSRLAESYLEANLALAASNATIAFYKPSTGVDEASLLVQQACALIAGRRLDEAALAAQSLPFHAERQFGSNLGAQRRFLLAAVASLSVSAQKLGCEGAVLDAIRRESSEVLTRAETLLEIQQAFLGLAESLIDEVRQLHADRGSRIVERVCRMVERNLTAGENAVKQSSLAASLGISASHLSRVFKQTTGQTFERYLMQRRVELAQRLLLDPAHNVSTVALQCGFADSSYFARVFRKLAGCSPAEYSRNPDVRRLA